MSQLHLTHDSFSEMTDDALIDTTSDDDISDDDTSATEKSRLRRGARARARARARADYHDTTSTVDSLDPAQQPDDTTSDDDISDDDTSASEKSRYRMGARARARARARADYHDTITAVDSLDRQRIQWIANVARTAPMSPTIDDAINDTTTDAEELAEENPVQQPVDTTPVVDSLDGDVTESASRPSRGLPPRHTAPEVDPSTICDGGGVIEEGVDEMPVVDDLSSDADASAHLPTGLGEQKRKRKSGGRRQAAKAAKCAEAEEGGYTDKGRAVYRNDGGVLVTGDKRTCVADAVSHLLPSFAIEVHVDTVRTMMSDDLDQDTKFVEADKCVRQFGLTLQRVTQRFMVKGGPELALLKSTGLFVVQLAIALDKDDKKPDKHCVAYDGATVRDNYKYAKVKEIDSTDRASPEAARAVINSLFKNMQVRIKNVYELVRV